MEWFFAFNEKATGWFAEMIKVAVRSATANTTLTPICLYDGHPNCMTDWLRDNGAVVLFTQVPFRAELFSPEIQSINSGTHYTPEHATGAFLRTEAAKHARHEVFAYTDCDVMFLRDDISSVRTDKIAAVPELSDARSFNSGVMVINRAFFSDRHAALIDYMRANGFYHRRNSSYDQCFLNEYFAADWDTLPPGLNWRPVQGMSEEASIIHFHGPKPTRIAALLAGKGLDAEANLESIVSLNPESYAAYVNKFQSYL